MGPVKVLSLCVMKKIETFWCDWWREGDTPQQVNYKVLKRKRMGEDAEFIIRKPYALSSTPPKFEDKKGAFTFPTPKLSYIILFPYVQLPTKNTY